MQHIFNDYLYQFSLIAHFILYPILAKYFRHNGDFNRIRIAAKELVLALLVDLISTPDKSPELLLVEFLFVMSI